MSERVILHKYHSLINLNWQPSLTDSMHLDHWHDITLHQDRKP